MLPNFNNSGPIGCGAAHMHGVAWQDMVKAGRNSKTVKVSKAWHLASGGLGTSQL